MLDRSRVREVFLEAEELPHDQRAPLLDRLCAGDAALRAEVESLLSSAAGRPSFLQSPTVMTPGEAPGKRIGPYRLLQEIGHGGFGSVYMAEQMEPVRRRVALKIIKLGMDTRAVIARFEAERQALALMDHANIARVFDAGATDSGRPYFVMELVRGEAITAYCDKNQLSIRDRLDLFLQVCRAVQHAHSKGIIHRDLKPSNILVATEDGRPHAKVIDFGIAKATDHRLTEKTVFTDFRQFMGTPEYMSPEQTEGSLNVDTRSDVYSLGVLLYELITGATPFDAKTLRSAAYAEIQRIIREVDPQKPSTRLSHSGTLAAVASHRGIEPRRLSALVSGDLDWIVMRALDKDRSRRYDTASALAADVMRHVRGEPVEAAPPSRAYRARKFVRKNSGLVAAATAVVAALVLGVIGTTIGLIRAHHAREAEETQKKEALANAQRAETQAERAGAAEGQAQARARELERVAAFQSAQLKEIDPSRMGSQLRDAMLEEARLWLERTEPDEAVRAARLAGLKKDLAGANSTNVALRTLERTIFDRAIEAIDRDFVDQPLVRARLLETIADTMSTLGLHARAIEILDRTIEVVRAARGDDHEDTLRIRSRAAGMLREVGRLSDADNAIRSVLETQTRVLGADHPDRLWTMDRLGEVLYARGRRADAEPIYREVLERRTRVLGENHEDTLVSLQHLAEAIKAQGRPAEAEPLIRRGLDLARGVYGESHRRTFIWMDNLCTVLWDQGKLDESEPYWGEDLVQTQRRVLGDDHPDLLRIINNTGIGLLRRGRPADSEPYFREAIQRMRRVLGEGHENTLVAINNLGNSLRRQGRLAESAEIHAQGLAACSQNQSAPERAMLLHHHAEVLLELKRLDDAKPPAIEAVTMYHAHADWNPREAYHAEQILADILVAKGDTLEAEPALRDLINRARASTPPNVPSLSANLYALGVNLLKQNRHSEAETVLRENLDIRRDLVPQGRLSARSLFNTMSFLGSAVMRQATSEALETEARIAKLREAEPLLLDAYRGLKDHPPAAAQATGDARAHAVFLDVALLYETWDSLEPGKGYAGKAAQWRQRTAEPPGEPR